MKAILFSLVLIIVSTSFSQTSDAKVTTAVLAFENGQYKSAFEKLSEALSNTDLLKPKNVAKAWYYKGLSLEAYVAQLSVEKNTEELKYYTNAYLDIYEAFVLCIKADEKFRYEQKIINKLLTLQPVILNVGVQYHLSGLFDLARDHYMTCIQINEFYLAKQEYLPFELLAQAELSLKDTSQAYFHSEKAVNIYKNGSKSSFDHNIGYAYYRLASLAYYHTEMENLDLALEWTEKGIQLLKKEQGDLKSENAENYSKQEKGYMDVIELLDNYRLNVLMKSKDNIDKALADFKKAIKQNPKDYAKRVSYAHLLEDIGDIEGAIEQYKSAVKIDSKLLPANYNLGAIYTNAAKEKFDAAFKIDDYQKSSLIQNEGKELLRLSVPYFESAHKADPKDIIIIKALKNAFLQLDDNDGFQKYKEKERVLIEG